MVKRLLSRCALVARFRWQESPVLIHTKYIRDDVLEALPALDLSLVVVKLDRNGTKTSLASLRVSSSRCDHLLAHIQTASLQRLEEGSRKTLRDLANGQKQTISNGGRLGRHFDSSAAKLQGLLGPGPSSSTNVTRYGRKQWSKSRQPLMEAESNRFSKASAPGRGARACGARLQPAAFQYQFICNHDLTKRYSKHVPFKILKAYFMRNK